MLSTWNILSEAGIDVCASFGGACKSFNVRHLAAIVAARKGGNWGLGLRSWDFKFQISNFKYGQSDPKP